MAPKESLKLLEKKPDFGQIVVLVGPDGGGKSFLAKQLVKDQPNTILINGTQPQSWPIPEEERQRLAKLKERYPNNNFRYFGLISSALHRTVYELANQGKDIVVDSEQTFKWLMWEALRDNLDDAMTALTAHKINAVLPDWIRYVVPEADNFDEQAELIWQRQNSKPEAEKSAVDPKNLGEVRARLKASEKVLSALEEIGVTIEGKPTWLTKGTGH